MAAKDYVINISGDTGKLEAAVKSADGQIRALNDNQVVISMDIEAGDIAKVRNAIQQMVNQDPTVNIQLSYELDKKNLEIAKKQVEELKNEYQEIWQNPNTKKSKDYLQGQVRSQAKAIDEALKGGAKQKDVINNYKALLRYAQSVKDATGIKNLDDDIEDLFGDIGKRGKQLQTATEDFFDGKIVGGYIDILRDKIGDVNKHINDLGSNITRLKRMGAQDYEGDGPISGLGEYVNTFERIAQMVRSLSDIEIPSLDKSGSMEDRAQRLKELAIEYDEAGKAIQSFQEQADGSTESQDQLALLQKYQFEVLKAYNKTLKAVGGNKNQTDFLKNFFPENTDFDIAYEDEEGIFEDVIRPIQKKYGDAFRKAMQEGGVVLDLDKLFGRDFQNLYDTELEKIMSGIEESVDKRLAGIEEDTAATEKNTEAHRENNEEKQKAEDSSSTQQQAEQIKQDTEEMERNTEAHRENNEEKERASETDNTQQTEQTKQDTEETERNTEAHRENNEEKERASESAETQDEQTEQTRQNTEEIEKNTEAHRENNEEKQKASETTSDQEKQTQQTQENTSKTEENTERTKDNTEEKKENAKASEEQAQADEKAAKAAEEKAEAEKKAGQAADETVNKTTTESSEGIGKEAQQFEDIATNARNAADAKADFVAANILVAQSAQESADAINKEIEALGKVAGAAGEAASGKSKLASSEGKRKSGGGGKKSSGAKVEEEDPAGVGGFAQDIEALENSIKVAKADIKSTVDKIKTSFKELGTDGKGLFGAISSGDVDTLFGFQQKLTNANDLVDSFGKAYGAEAIDKYKLSGLSSSLIQGVLKNFRENIEKQIGAQVKTLDKNDGADLTNSAKYVLETARADLSRASDQAKSLTDFDIDGMLEMVRTVTNAGKRISDITSDMSDNKYVDSDSVNKAINNITETLSNAAPGEARDKLEAIKSSLQEMKGAADAAGESFVKITEADFADTTSQVKELSDAIKETTKYDNREANDLTDSYRAMGALGKDYLSALKSDDTDFIDSYTAKLEQLRGRFEMLKSSLGESAPQVVKVQAAMDNYERGMSKMFDASFGSQFESRIEKINKALADPKYTTEFKANLTECKTTLESMNSEFDSISMSSEKSFSSDTIRSFVNRLKDADSALEKLNDKSNVYASAGQVDNLLRKVNKDIESMSLSGEVKDGYIELQKALQGISEEASKAADGMAKISKERMTGFSDTWKNLNQKAIAQGMNQPKFLNQFRSAITNQSAQFLGQYFSLQDFVRYGRELAQTVISIDTGMTELRKVSGETDTRLDQSFKASAASAKEYGATITDIIKSTADWSRLGYGIDQAEQLAKVTQLYQNVGDNMTQENASEYLVSTLQGFQMEASEAENVVDRINEVANNYAIDTAGRYARVA